MSWVRTKALAALLGRQRRDGEGSGTPDEETSTLTNGTWAVTANGVATATLTYTCRNTPGSTLPNQAVTMAVSRTFVSASASLVEALDPTIPDDGTTEATIRLTVIDTVSGIALPGIPASAISLASSRGATDTITEVSTVTDYLGQFYFTVVSSTAGNPVFTATVVSVVVTDTATFEVSGSGFAAPSIYEWDFEGATNAIASGNLVLGGGSAMINGTDWVRDTVVFHSGAQSVKQTYPISGGNVGVLFMYNIASPVAALYTRFWYHQTSPFNDDGGGDNNDIVKMVRIYKANFQGAFGSLVIQSGSEYKISSDNLAGAQGGLSFSPNVNLPAPTPNDLVDSWNAFEYLVDYTTTGAIIMRVWINDVLYFDYTLNCSNQYGGADVLAGNVQFDGTINSMASVSVNNYDDVAFSITRIGAAV